MTKSANVVLLIEDDPKIGRFIRAGLELSGYLVHEARGAFEALRLATSSPPDLVILDSVLPDLPGDEVLERIRSWSNVPVIILSVISIEEEKVRLLKAGADDYIVKPFGMAELLARCKAALRRSFKTATESHIVNVGPLSVDLAAQTATLDAKLVDLTRKEYRLLHLLAMNVGLVVTHDHLIEKIWPNASRDNIQYLRLLVRNLRQKIEPDPNVPRLIVTESGVGYRLQKQIEAPIFGQR
jgi:two-component system, OmpR family, KDP operon response regulator KdpE